MFMFRIDIIKVFIKLLSVSGVWTPDKIPPLTGDNTKKLIILIHDLNLI